MATKAKEASHPFSLVAIRDADKYRKGDLVNDGKEITRLLKSHRHDFTKVAKPN
jgi:hypothetical protein